jgi:hypothetical protein
MSSQAASAVLSSHRIDLYCAAVFRMLAHTGRCTRDQGLAGEKHRSPREGCARTHCPCAGGSQCTLCASRSLDLLRFSRSNTRVRSHQGHLAATQTLLERGYLSVYNDSRSIARLTRQAVRGGLVTLVRALVEMGVLGVDAKVDQSVGHTLVMYAAKKGQV